MCHCIVCRQHLDFSWYLLAFSTFLSGLSSVRLSMLIIQTVKSAFQCDYFTIFLILLLNCLFDQAMFVIKLIMWRPSIFWTFVRTSWRFVGLRRDSIAIIRSEAEKRLNQIALIQVPNKIVFLKHLSISLITNQIMSNHQSNSFKLSKSNQVFSLSQPAFYIILFWKLVVVILLLYTLFIL